MKRAGLLLILMMAFLSGCRWPAWTGKYYSKNCMTLEYVEFFPDKTADIKYWGASFAVNRKMTIKGNKFYVEKFMFEYREDGRMYEMSGLEWGCVLEKDTVERNHSGTQQ